MKDETRPASKEPATKTKAVKAVEKPAKVPKAPKPEPVIPPEVSQELLLAPNA